MLHCILDIQNCIWRHEPSQTGIGVTKSSSTLPVHLRSTRIPLPRAQLLPKITAVLAEHGISISRLVMPTRANLERMEALQTAATVLLETKKAVDRVDLEIRTLKEAQKEAREMAETGNIREERVEASQDRDVDMEVDDEADTQRGESSAPGRHGSSSVMRESEEPSGSVGPQSVAEKRMVRIERSAVSVSSFNFLLLFDRAPTTGSDPCQRHQMRRLQPPGEEIRRSRGSNQSCLTAVSLQTCFHLFPYLIHAYVLSSLLYACN